MHKKKIMKTKLVCLLALLSTLNLQAQFVEVPIGPHLGDTYWHDATTRSTNNAYWWTNYPHVWTNNQHTIFLGSCTNGAAWWTNFPPPRPMMGVTNGFWSNAPSCSFEDLATVPNPLWWTNTDWATNAVAYPTVVSNWQGWDTVNHNFRLLAAVLAAGTNNAAWGTNRVLQLSNAIVTLSNSVVAWSNDLYTAIGTGGGGSQTPWMGDIDGGGFNLVNVNTMLFGVGAAGSLNDDGSADLTGLSVGGYLGFDGANGLISSIHFAGSQVIGVPTVAVGPGADISDGSAVLDGNATDVAMTVTLTTGSAPSASGGALFTVTFLQAYASAPHVTFSAASGTAANGASGGVPPLVYVDSVTTTGFCFYGVNDMGAATDYVWTFLVAQ